MKKRLAVIAGLIVGVFISSVGLFGCQGCQPAPELVEEVPETFINETLNFELTDPVPTPTPDVDSYRGSEIENLVVQYAQSYENDDYLKEDVSCSDNGNGQNSMPTLKGRRKKIPATSILTGFRPKYISSNRNIRPRWPRSITCCATITTIPTHWDCRRMFSIFLATLHSATRVLKL